MSTDDDQTRPVPTTPATTPMPQADRVAGPADDPTTPVPRPGAGRTEEPTQVIDTSTTEPARPAADGPTGPGSPTTPVSLG